MILLLIYGYGLRISRHISEERMWRPLITQDTNLNEPEDPAEGERVFALWGRFAMLAVVVARSGWIVGRAGLSLVAATGLSATLVAVAFTSVATSLPELVTGIAAVRAVWPSLVPWDRTRQPSSKGTGAAC